MSALITKTPGWLDWFENPSTPRFTLPAGAVDAHCHVFGPGAEFPFASERKYTPCDASKEQLFALRDQLGISRNVIVQATCHGADNTAMVDAVQAAAGRARGVATVRPDVTDTELRRLAAKSLCSIGDPSTTSALVGLLESTDDELRECAVEGLGKIGTPEYRAVLKIEDPYEYLGRPRLKMPKFMIDASGDQFFLPDNSQFYYPDLPEEKHIRYVLICDDCGEEVREVYVEPYVPDPVIGPGAGFLQA